MPTLITGSFAYDTIMVFRDQFKNHILPDRMHMLNVCFQVPELRREFGGCAGNIAYNLKLLGGEPLPMGTVGKDFAPYRKWLCQHHIEVTHISEIADTYTAQAFLTTDIDNNQIVAFHPGAMQHARQQQVTDVTAGADIRLGIVAPNDKNAMLQYVTQFHAADIPFIFDPGQGLPMFTGDELARCIERATYIVVNHYEAELLQQKIGKNLAQIAARVAALVVTRGGEGADFYHDGHVMRIQAAHVKAAKDPTGCGDAFRAGLLYGLAKQLDWQTSGQIASLLGAIKIEHPGTQNHRLSKAQFEKRYKENFGATLRLNSLTP